MDNGRLLLWIQPDAAYGLPVSRIARPPCRMLSGRDVTDPAMAMLSGTGKRTGREPGSADTSHPSSTPRWRGRHDGAVAVPCAGARLGDHDGAVLPPHAGCDTRSIPRQDTVAHHLAAAQQSAPEASWQTAVGGRHPAPPGVLCASGGVSVFLWARRLNNFIPEPA